MEKHRCCKWNYKNMEKQAHNGDEHKYYKLFCYQ